jgi:hypothetical protein
MRRATRVPPAIGAVAAYFAEVSGSSWAVS